MPRHKRFLNFIRRKHKGFTLIEIIVAIVILGILVIATVLVINPFKQISRTQDAVKVSDIRQIGNALTLYYNDHNCYAPQSVLLPLLSSGGEWSEGGTIYMKKVPIAPDKYTYDYITDNTSACPQWAVVFGKLNSTTSQDPAAQNIVSQLILGKPVSLLQVPVVNASAGSDSICHLVSISDCVPQGFDPTWACSVLGTPDCTVISSQTIDHIYSVPSGGGGGGSCSQQDKNYACTGDPARCNVLPAGTGTYCGSNCDGNCP